MWLSFLFLFLVSQSCLCLEDFPTIENLVLPEGYPLERHEVVTDDGYVLALFRIPHGRQASPNASLRPVVYLQHGLLGTCAGFLTNGAPDALGFLFADNGFDVWMGNSRGNTYSNFTIQRSDMSHDTFWDFSLDDLVAYDLPASLEHVLAVTGVRKLIYLGYSQGTAAAHALFSTRHPISKRVALAIMLSPVAFVRHITSHFLRGLAIIDTDEIVKLLGYDQFLPNNELFHRIGGPFCRWRLFDCADVFSILYGYNPDNIDDDKWDIYFTYAPAGASVKLMAHWAQGVRNRNATRFQKFDYGTECNDPWTWEKKKCNRDVYGTELPPEYDLGMIQVPMVYFSGGHDALADTADIMNLKERLAEGVLLEHYVELDYTHLDMIWGIDAKWKVHPLILDKMKSVVRKEKLAKRRHGKRPFRPAV